MLEEASAEVDELDDVLLSCNENAEIYTKSTIKKLFRSNHFNRADSDDQQATHHVLGWQVLNEQKHFASNSTYLLVKQASHKDSGIYYCIFRVPYLSFFSSILPNALVSNLSRLWAGCQAAGQFECIASFKYKLIVRKAKRRFLNSLALPDDFKERCLIIKNGKQIAQYKTLSLVAMFLASMIFFLLLFYFISLYRDSLATTQKLTKKSHKKQLKRLRSEQIDENLKIIKSFEHIKEDEQELLRRLRHEQEKLSNKRREDEEFFNKIKIHELDLVKRKEEVLKEEEELLRKRAKFEREKKAMKAEGEMKRKKSEEPIRDQFLGQQTDRRSSSGEREINLKGLKGLDNLGNRSISLNIKGEIKLKPPGSCDRSCERPCNENKQLVELGNFSRTSDVIDLNGLSKKMKQSRKSIFSSGKSPVKVRSSHKLDREKYHERHREKHREKHRDPPNLKPFGNFYLNKKTGDKSPGRRLPNLDRLNEDRKTYLKRKLMTATHIGVNNNFRDDSRGFRKESKLERLRGHHSEPLAKFKKDKKERDKRRKRLDEMEDDKRKERLETANGALDVESTIDILKRNESIFKTKGKFKMDPNLCDKPIKLVVECGPLSENKTNLTK